MKQPSPRWIVGAAALAVASCWSGLAAAGQGPDAQVKRGALLYDNWPKLVGARLEGNHPLYPKTAKKSGEATWRCKECHGWDYVGAEGRYAKGSHYTGIPGVWKARTQPAERLMEAMGGGLAGHDFSAHLVDEDRRALAAFLRHGLLDFAAAADAGGKARGSAEAGKPVYYAECAGCHGADGRAIDFKGKEEGVQGVGWIARDNPQESLHKIRWGHPGSDMGSLLVDGDASEGQAVDVLTYCQTLP